MGPSIRFPNAALRRVQSAARLWTTTAPCAMKFVALIALGLAAPAIAHAQTVAPPSAPVAAAAQNPDRLVLEANELVYDKDHDTVTAVGAVQLYYKHRILQADKVIYNRTTKRLFAEGHAKLTDERGDITYADRFDLTQDFAAGFAEGVQMMTTDKTRFTSPRVERQAGQVTVFNGGVYTACEPCQNHPERPPLWQVRATRIIENQQVHTVYYEDAWLEVAGVPIAYIPYFSAPDPTVTRQTGVLSPSFYQGSYTGFGFGVPYFIDLAPNYDLTLRPVYYSAQGPFGDVEWRQRMDTGEYAIRVTGIDQQDPSLFPPAPYGAGNRTWRGSLETTGEFYINQNWKYGWDITAVSDPFYINDYHIKDVSPSQYYFQDLVSEVYLRGQADRGFFDVSGYHFESTVATTDQRTEPPAVPVFDYNKTFNLSPESTYGLGGEFKFDFNATDISRTEALFQSTGAQTLDNAFNLYNVCGLPGTGTLTGGVRTGATTAPSAYTPGNCILQGIAGNYARASEQVSWQKKYVDPIGEEWTPFVFARLDGELTDLNTTSQFSYGSSTVYNSSQTNFFGGASSELTARAMPGVGLEYRYPFVSNSFLGQQTITPIAQFIVRPNEVVPRVQPNEDAQSLVFDETNLFAWDKYSGYDRIEGGTRLNYGIDYTANFANGGHASVVGGESIQVAGQNSYTIPSPDNIGLESGLDKQFSNFVAGETIAPFSTDIFSFTSKQQFDSSTFGLTRLDLIGNYKLGGFSGSLDYGQYAAQPLLGFLFPRQGLQTNASYKFSDVWSVDGSVLFDMSRHYYDVPGQNTPIFYPTNYSFGLTYQDTCTTVKAIYQSELSDPIASTPAIRDTTFLLQITLRTLGDVQASVGLQGQ